MDLRIAKKLMNVYIDSVIWNDINYVPFMAKELLENHKVTKSDVYFINTSNNYMINIPAGNLVQVREKTPRNKPKLISIESLYENHDDYQIVFKRPSVIEWRDKVFSSIKFESTLQELIVSAFVLGYVSSKKKSLLKRNKSLRERIDKTLASKIDIYARSYTNNKSFKSTLDDLDRKISTFFETDFAKSYTREDTLPRRINRLIGYLLTVTKVFGTLDTASMYFVFNEEDSEYIRLAQYELLNVGIVSSYVVDKNSLKISFTKYNRTLSLISALLFDMEKPDSRYFYSQKITHMEMVEDLEVIDLDKSEYLFVDGVYTKYDKK